MSEVKSTQGGFDVFVYLLSWYLLSRVDPTRVFERIVECQPPMMDQGIKSEPPFIRRISKTGIPSKSLARDLSIGCGEVSRPTGEFQSGLVEAGCALRDPNDSATPTFCEKKRLN